MLDLFGGTGMVTLEAASRGCGDITYIDRHRPCVQWVKQITADLGVASSIAIRPFDVKRFIKSQEKKSTTYDFIFADPPYDWPDMHKLSDMIYHADLLTDDGLLVIEHSSTTNLTLCQHWVEDRKYGSSTFSFFV
jgi:16S rRNA (guanine(966)-N(2))-methyltransferase RsmD